MRSFHTALASLSLAGALAAQTTDDKFEIYPARNAVGTSYVSRPTPITTSNLEMLQEVPGSHFAGVGDNGLFSCEATAFILATQDQNQATAETFNVIFRQNNPSGGPLSAAAGLLLRTGDLTYWGSGSGPAGAVLTVTFATPLSIPCLAGFSYGIEFRAAPSWPADGQALLAADYGPSGTLGDNPRAGAPKHAFVVVAGGLVSPTTSPMVLAVGLRSKAPNTNMGNLDPASTRTANKISFGAGGMYPAVKLAPRDDGLVLRVIDTPNNGGSGHVFMSVGMTTFPTIFLPGVYGHIWLPPAGPVIYMGSFFILDDNGVGVGTVTIANPGTIPAAVGITLSFTTITLNAGYANGRLTNAQGVKF